MLMSNDSVCEVSVSGWKRFTYIGDAAEYSDIQNVIDDPSENWSTYYRDDVLPKSALPLTLLLIWILILLVYIIWRLVLIIERCCCGIQRPQQSSYQKYVTLLTGKASFLSKIFLSFFGLCAFGWYVYGIVVLASEPNVVSKGFDVVENLEVQLNQVVVKSYSLQTEFQSIPNQIVDLNRTVAEKLDDNTLQNITQCVRNGVISLHDLSQIERNISSIRQSVEQTISPTLNNLNSQIPQLRNSVSPLLSPLINNNGNQTAFEQAERALAQVKIAMDNISNSTVDEGRAQELQLRLQELQRVNSQLQSEGQVLAQIDQVLSTYGQGIQSVLQDVEILVDTSRTLQDQLPGMLQEVNQIKGIGDEVLPCVDSLINNLQAINNSIISLPQEASQLLDTITVWKSTLTLVTDSDQLSQLINQIEDLVEVTSQQLSSYSETILSFDLQNIRSNLQRVQQSLQSGNSAIVVNSGLQNQLSLYLQNPTQQGYLQLKLLILLNEAQIETTQEQVSQWSSDVNQANGALIDIQQFLNGQIVDFQSLQQQIPNDAEFQALQQAVEDVTALQGPNLDTDLQQLNTFSQQITQEINQAVSTLLTDVNEIVDNVSRTINSSMNTLQIDVINKISDFTEDHRSDSEKAFDWIQIIGVYILFPIIILLIVSAIIFTISNFTFGIETSLILIIITTLLIVIVGFVASNVSIVDNDVCAHAEILIVHEVEKEYGVNDVVPAFIRHILYGNEGGIESILRRYFNYDNNKIINQINLLDQKVQNALNSLGSNPGQRVDQILDLIYTFPSKIDIILALLSFSQLNLFYVQLENVSCCDLRDYITSYNQIVALGGFLTIPVVVGLLVWLHWLRKLPPSRFSCAVCYCRNTREFKLDIPPIN